MDPSNPLKERQVLRRKAEEAAYEQALQEFQSGQLRTGVMAQAIAKSGGDEAKAKAAYVELAAQSILDDQYIAKRVDEAPTDSSVYLLGGLSLVVPGLGQLMQGRVGPGIAHLVLALLLWMILLGWIVHIYSMINAATFERARHSTAVAKDA